jgi:putative peptidoglycan lipid II flippase
LFFSIPASFVLFFFPDIIISVLFERGEFGLKEKNATIEALKAYSVGIPAFIILKSCQPAFLAEGNTKTPMYIGIVLLILNITLSLSLMNYFFHAGIALATSLSSWIGCLIYIILLIKNRKISLIKDKIYKKSISIFSILIFSLKLIMISSLMILIMKGSLYYFRIYEIKEFFALTVLIFIGLLIYFLTCVVLGYIPEDLLKKRVFISKERK